MNDVASVVAGVGKTKLDSGWIAARSTEVELDGIQLTTAHPASAGTGPWMEAIVPGTVLATLVKNKAVPDPFYGMNNEAIIDIADSGREYYTFWFYTTFQCKWSGMEHIYLNFRAINYSAEVYLNGHKMVLPEGMFRRHSLDISENLHPNGLNKLAVLVHPPNHPGSIPPEGGQGGDHEIGKDVAAQYVQGWDWMCPIRDRNTGIWDEVSISVSGVSAATTTTLFGNFSAVFQPVKLLDPHLVSSFYDHYKRAYLHATTELENKSAKVAECTLQIQVTTETEENLCLVEDILTQHISVAPGSRTTFTFPEIFFYKPNLWWPNGMGKQPLYHVSISVEVEGYGESDTWNHLFGFRKIESHVDSATSGRLFKVNGQPIFIRGGNWILSDGLLRLSEERYATDIKFHANMNFNMIRCWGGGLAERPEFYHYCDIHGILVWQEFWITGDVDGRGIPVSNPDGPLDHNLFLTCAKDTIKLLRNHASLALWVGGNEQVPPPDINAALKDYLRLHPHFRKGDVIDSITEIREEDPSLYLDGTRIYVEGSMWDGFANGKGDFSDGPYEIQYPEDFFKDDFYQYGFNPEVGSVGMPVAATIRATMPEEGCTIPIFRKLSNGYIEEIPNPIWNYHKYIPYSKPGKVHDQILQYGIPKDLDDFCLKAQLVNYVQYKALLEGWTSHMWTKFTGVLIWKTQNPWTGLRGQFYDHLLDQTAGFYGCRSAAEPIHVQLSLHTYFIEVVNTTSEELTDIAIEVSAWDLNGACPYYKVFDKLSVPAKKTLRIVEMDYPKSKSPEPVYFLLLKLYSMSDYGILSRNFYWLHLPGGDYKPLEVYRRNKVPLKITSQAYIKGSTYEIDMHVQNTSKKTDPKNLLNKNISHLDKELNSTAGTKCLENSDSSLLHSIRKCFFKGGDESRTTILNGTNAGVAFFLNFSVHGLMPDHKKGEDTRILPVHYSDNYFSLVPGETTTVKLTFKVPNGVTPRVSLSGWNYHHEGHTVH